MRKLFIFLVGFCALAVSAQVSTVPAIIQPGYTGEIVITYDATRGNGGMVGATKCYAHTGLITSASSSDTDWKNVVGGWRTASQPELTSLGNNKWELVIPNMYEFYGVPETTEIKKLAFVFHDGPGGSKEGKTSANGNILIVLGEKPEGDIWETVEGVTPTTKARPSGVSNGIYYGEDGTSVTLCTYAASRTEAANRVFLIGDMTDWKLSADYQLFKDDNYFWITLTGLTKGKEYRFQYAVERADGVRKQICDLYSEKVLHPDDQWEPRTADPTLIGYPKKGADGSYVTVIQPGKAKYEWSDATLNFKRPNKNNLIIYEAWVLDYTTKRTFKGMMDRLDYIQNLGVNAIELMPVTEFDGNQSWGYNPALYFAMDKSYGKAEDMKAFIDECHKRGIAVILDMVFNHTTGNNPMAKLYPWTSSSPTQTELRFNPWFNVGSEVKHDDNDYGEDWNHSFEPAHEMFTRVLKYWLTEFKVDGYRLDLSHGICGRGVYDAVEELKDYYDKGVKGVSSDAYMILEHWGSKMGSDRPQLIGYGMQCWTNTNNAYCQTAMGWLKDGDSFEEANKDGYVSYCESHDEERMQYKAKMYGYNDSIDGVKWDEIRKNDAVRLGRVAENVAFNVLLNGSHMLWQFEEIGYDISIDQNGRTGTKPNPKSKGYFTQEARIDAFTKCAQVITLRTQLIPTVFEGNPTEVSIGSGRKMRTIRWGNDVFAAANFAPKGNQAVTLPSGTWYDYLGGGQRASGTYTLAPGELKVFTGQQLIAPTFADIEKRDRQGIEPVQSDQVQSTKVLRDGQLLILRGDKVYTVTGMEVR